ncbi:site-2 protease family protein [Demequina sp. NBRC 110052]|uniref:site-2 protease family protein n=1 Tax=Demequina sp. NBRC 110052 TaxID=1570341 RepID=UPI000A011146|nr:site-2 protease family protein [Demequina sp. NBRC 110052]
MPSSPRPTRGFQLGTLVGARVIVQPSTLLMLAALAFLFASGTEGGMTRRAFTLGLALAVSLFVSVFLHEAAHAVAARAFGRRVDEIVITLWGGHTSFDSTALTARVSGVTAVAGPLANVAIGLALMGIGAALPLTGIGAGILSWAAYANLLLAAFNLLPGIPMDGGRVLEAIVWAVTGRRHTGTIVAAWGGRVVAVGVLLWAVVPPLLRGAAPSLFTIVWAFLIFSILWPAASQALRWSQTLARREGVSAASLMRPAVALRFDASVAAALNLADDAGAEEVVVLAADDAAAGRFPVTTAREVPADRRETTGLDAVTTPLPRGAAVTVGADAEALVEALREWWGRTDAWVVLSEGEPVGVVRLLDAMNALR